MRGPQPRRSRLGSSRACSIAVVAVLSLSWIPIVHADRDHACDLDRDDDDAPAVDLELDIDADAAASPVVVTPPGGSGPLRSRMPAVAEVLDAAYRAAGLARDPTGSWIRRARIAGLVPWVTVRTGWDASWHDDDPDVGRGRTFEVRATWRLDRLLFDGRELQMSSIETARRRERRRLASRVIQAYFHWRKVGSLARRDARYLLAAEAATAELDALTDGWFSDRANTGE